MILFIYLLVYFFIFYLFWSRLQLVHDALRERILTGNERVKVDALRKVRCRVPWVICSRLSYDAVEWEFTDDAVKTSPLLARVSTQVAVGFFLLLTRRGQGCQPERKT